MADVRIDSWAAKLDEEQAWRLYYKAKTCHWCDAAQWAVKEFGLDRQPSRSAFYAWRDMMHLDEHDHRMHEAAKAAAEAAALGGKVTRDDSLIAALKALATEAALRTDAETAAKLIQSAMAIKDRLIKDDELKLKTEAQQLSAEQLRLAREKFEAAEKRLNAVQDAVAAARNKGGLTEETLKKIEEAAGLL